MNKRDKLAFLAMIVIAFTLGYAANKAPAFIDHMTSKYCKECK